MNEHGAEKELGRINRTRAMLDGVVPERVGRYTLNHCENDLQEKKSVGSVRVEIQKHTRIVNQMITQQKSTRIGIRIAVLPNNRQ